MKALRYSHRCGDHVVPAGAIKDIEDAIVTCGVHPGKGTSVKIRKAILDVLRKHGWTDEFEVDPATKITITAYKNRTGLCLQTGNMSRMYADILKLQTLYLRETIDSAFFIVPTHKAAAKMGDNIVNLDRLSRELSVFGRTVTIPMLVLGIE